MRACARCEQSAALPPPNALGVAPGLAQAQMAGLSLPFLGRASVPEEGRCAGALPWNRPLVPEEGLILVVAPA